MAGASWCNLTDDVTTCPMMTSFVSFHQDVIIVKLLQEPPHMAITWLFPH